MKYKTNTRKHKKTTVHKPRHIQVNQRTIQLVCFFIPDLSHFYVDSILYLSKAYCFLCLWQFFFNIVVQIIIFSWDQCVLLYVMMLHQVEYNTSDWTITIKWTSRIFKKRNQHVSIYSCKITRMCLTLCNVLLYCSLVNLYMSWFVYGCFLMFSGICFVFHGFL
jgi:hypothetical protein